VTKVKIDIIFQYVSSGTEETHDKFRDRQLPNLNSELLTM
jgi:hypothetical protein